MERALAQQVLKVALLFHLFLGGKYSSPPVRERGTG